MNLKILDGPVAPDLIFVLLMMKLMGSKGQICM